MDYLHVYNNHHGHVPRTPTGQPCLSPVLPPIKLALDHQHSLTFGYASPRCLPTPILPSLSANAAVGWSQQVLTIPVPIRSTTTSRMIPMITPIASPRSQFEATTPSPSLAAVPIRLPDLKLPPSPVLATAKSASLPVLPKIVVGNTNSVAERTNNEELVRGIPDYIDCAKTRTQLSKARSGKQLIACAQAYRHPVNENEIDNINNILTLETSFSNTPSPPSSHCVSCRSNSSLECTHSSISFTEPRKLIKTSTNSLAR